MKHAWTAGLLLVGSVCAASPALAQMESREGIALQNQILDLRHQLDMLRSQPNVAPAYAPPPMAPPVSRNQPAPVTSDITAQLLARVGDLEEQVRELRGRVDELTNGMQQSRADIEKEIGDLGFRVQTLENGGHPPAAPGSATVAPAPQPAAPAAARRTPELAMQEGNAALARRDYPAAEAAAREVLALRGPRAADAQFLLAQSLLGQRNYPAAALAYNDSYERSRSGPHAQDSLLGFANSLIALNDTRAACDTLGRLATEFPTARPDLREPINNARARANCR